MQNSELMKYKSPENYLSTTYIKPNKLTFTDYKYTINVFHGKLISKKRSEKNITVCCAVN